MADVPLSYFSPPLHIDLIIRNTVVYKILLAQWDLSRQPGRLRKGSKADLSQCSVLAYSGAA